MAAFRRYTTDELVAGRPLPRERERTRMPVIVVLDDVRSAHNVGLVFRLCDCVNVEALWLTGITAWPGVSEHATNRIRKTAVGGSLDVLPWEQHDDPLPKLRRLKEEGWRIVVLEQGEGSLPWREASYATPLVLVFGHEREGVRDELLEIADEIAELPIRGITNSLNVALCASAVLYEVLARWGVAEGSGESTK